jgi:hypothetical protein
VKTFPHRLRPGQDLKRELNELVLRHDWPAACLLTGIGSLTQAAIRFANRDETSILDGPLEIVSLNGTLSRDGAHLHISVSDGDGQVFGGHLMEGSTVYTTAEVVLAVLPDWEFSRSIDPATGYAELSIKPTEPGE